MQVFTNFLLPSNVLLILFGLLMAEEHEERLFKKVTIVPSLTDAEIISTHNVHSEADCSFKCLNEEYCVGFKYKPATKDELENCQLSNSTGKSNMAIYNDQGWQFFVSEQNVLEGEIESDAKPVCPAASKIRLNGSCDHKSGRVEIYNEIFGWGTICDDHWDLKDGNVTCRQLGFTGAKMIGISASYGQGTGPILLDDVHCTGSESFIWDCPHLGMNKENCNHSEDAGVECF